jgi:hypothetical protein
MLSAVHSSKVGCVQYYLGEIIARSATVCDRR